MIDIKSLVIPGSHDFFWLIYYIPLLSTLIKVEKLFVSFYGIVINTRKQKKEADFFLQICS